MQRVSYIILGTGLLPVYSLNNSEYLLLEDLPAALATPLHDWLAAQQAVEVGVEPLPPAALSKFRFTVFLIEHKLSDLLG